MSLGFPANAGNPEDSSATPPRPRWQNLDDESAWGGQNGSTSRPLNQMARTFPTFSMTFGPRELRSKTMQGKSEFRRRKCKYFLCVSFISSCPHSWIQTVYCTIYPSIQTLWHTTIHKIISPAFTIPASNAQKKFACVKCWDWFHWWLSAENKWHNLIRCLDTRGKICWTTDVQLLTTNALQQYEYLFYIYLFI